MLDRKGMNNPRQTCSTLGSLGIFAGHFPSAAVNAAALDAGEAFLPVATKQKMAMIAGDACGVLTLAAGWRRLYAQASPV